MTRRHLKKVAVVFAAGAALVLAAPAGAHTSGSETFKGLIVASGASGTRTVVSSVVVAKGVFNGVGRIVEVDNLPTDPDNVSRDDLVFARGSMHLVSVTLDASFSINRKTCLYSATLQQIGTIEGGTGKFAHAAGSSTATVKVHGLAARNPDGSCSEEQVPLLDVDTITSTGTLSF